jgi:hypothetical protein
LIVFYLIVYICFITFSTSTFSAQIIMAEEVKRSVGEVKSQQSCQATSDIEEVDAGTSGLLDTGAASSSSSSTEDTGAPIVDRVGVPVRNYEVDPNDIDSSEDESEQPWQYAPRVAGETRTDPDADADADGATSGEDEFGEFTSAGMNAYVTLEEDPDDADGDYGEDGDREREGGFITAEPLFIPSERGEGKEQPATATAGAVQQVSFSVEEAFPPPPPKPVPRIAPLGGDKIATIKAAMAGLNFKKKAGLDAFCDQILRSRPRFGDEGTAAAVGTADTATDVTATAGATTAAPAEASVEETSAVGPNDGGK